MFIPALGTGVVALGLYIIFQHFFVNEPPLLRSDAVFHIGCYDPDYTNNHSLELSRRLMQIDEKANADIKLSMYHSVALAPDFEDQVHELAIAFDEYINNYYQYKVRSERDLQYYNSLQLAKRDFDTCAKNQLLDQEACLNDWNHYQGTLQSFASLKKELGNLINGKEAQERRISAVILQQTDEDQSDIQKKYITKIHELKTKLSKCEQKIVELKTRKGKLWQEISIEENNLEDQKNLLNECVKNKQLITFCKKISDDIYKFKKSVPQRNKNTIELRITQKRKIIDGLELNLRKIQKYGTSDEVLKAERELRVQKKQLSLLQIEVSNFDTTQESKCAKCSEEKIVELRKNIDALTKLIADRRTLHAELSGNLNTQENTMNQLKADITSATQARQAEINTKFCVDDKCKQDQRENLLRLEGALNEMKKQIIDKQIQINFITSSQKKKLQTMNKYLPKIQQATECLLKKDFYEQLKTKAPKKTDMNEKMIGCRDKVMKELSDFEL